MEIKCEKCGTLNNENSKFCKDCGNSLNSEKPTIQEKTANNINCPFCGEKIALNSEKCNYCGEYLDKSLGHNILIVIGYAFMVSFFVVGIFGFIGSLIISIYLIRQDYPRDKTHGKIQLIISVIALAISLIILVLGFALAIFSPAY